jgi:triosephosphate isomerase (TIM)
MARRKITAGNWKMNLTPKESVVLVQDVMAQLSVLAEDSLVIFCPAFLNIHSVAQVLNKTDNSQILLGAQNCHPAANGAYTGETNIAMLKASDVQAVIIGHSERRELFGESNTFIKEKVDALLAADLLPIFCCGEPLSVREANNQNEYVLAQIEDSLFHLDAESMSKVVIAYEPIWAIGTGVTATTKQAQEIHAFIRKSIATKYDGATADCISILYGGSCNPTNAAELFSQPDIDGGLIGGASLKADQFVAVCAAM